MAISVLAVVGAQSTGQPANDTQVYGIGSAPAGATVLATVGNQLPTAATGGFTTPTVPVHVDANGYANFFVNGVWINGLTGNPTVL